MRQDTFHVFAPAARFSPASNSGAKILRLSLELLKLHARFVVELRDEGFYLQHQAMIAVYASVTTAFAAYRSRSAAATASRSVATDF
jgi:hypothetical protein